MNDGNGWKSLALGMIALFHSPEVKFYLAGNLVLQRLVELTLFGVGVGEGTGEISEYPRVETRSP